MHICRYTYCSCLRRLLLVTATALAYCVMPTLTAYCYGRCLLFWRLPIWSLLTVMDWGFCSLLFFMATVVWVVPPTPQSWVPWGVGGGDGRGDTPSRASNTNTHGYCVRGRVAHTTLMITLGTPSGPSNTNTEGYCARGRVADATLMMTSGWENGGVGRDTIRDQQHI